MPWVMTTYIFAKIHIAQQISLTATIQRRYKTEVSIIEQTLRAWVTVDHHALSVLRPHLDLLRFLILQYLRPKFSHLQLSRITLFPQLDFQ